MRGPFRRTSSWPPACRPGPVHAFAQPLLTTTARACPPVGPRCSRDTITGAAVAWLVVNRPAAVAGDERRPRWRGRAALALDAGRDAQPSRSPSGAVMPPSTRRDHRIVSVEARATAGPATGGATRRVARPAARAAASGSLADVPARARRAAAPRPPGRTCGTSRSRRSRARSSPGTTRAVRSRSPGARSGWVRGSARRASRTRWFCARWRQLADQRRRRVRALAKPSSTTSERTSATARESGASSAHPTTRLPCSTTTNRVACSATSSACDRGSRCPEAQVVLDEAEDRRRVARPCRSGTRRARAGPDVARLVAGRQRVRNGRRQGPG